MGLLGGGGKPKEGQGVECVDGEGAVDKGRSARLLH
jgi:hypothetical protein